MKNLHEKFTELQSVVHRMEKCALDVNSILSHISPEALGLYASTFYGVHKLGKMGQKQGPTFLRSGIELGQKQKKPNFLVQDALRNWLGKSTADPTYAGLSLGQDVKRLGLQGEEADQFVNNYAEKRVHQSNESLRGLKEHRDHYSGAFNPDVLDELEMEAELSPVKAHSVDQAFSGMLQGEGDNAFKKAIVRTGIPEGSKRRLHHSMAQYGYSLPLAAVDKRFMLRPVLRQLGETPVGKKVNEVVPQDAAIRKVRNFID